MPSKLIHTQPSRECAERRVEVLDDTVIRIGLWRGSAAATDPVDFVMVSGFALNVDDARELRAAIGLAITEIEAGGA